MKRKILIGIEVFLITLLAVALVSVFGNQAGSSADPLVAKSYVDDRIDEVLRIFNKNGGSVSLGEQVGDVAASNFSYVPVSAKAGQTVYGQEGTEIILRSGRAKGKISGENGIVDISTGAEIFNNTEVLKNHLLIVPRTDGRGLQVLEDAWFLIKGAYTIE